jgi:hypothetical protein
LHFKLQASHKSPFDKRVAGHKITNHADKLNFN